MDNVQDLDNRGTRKPGWVTLGMRGHRNGNGGVKGLHRASVAANRAAYASGSEPH